MKEREIEKEGDNMEGKEKESTRGQNPKKKGHRIFFHCSQTKCPKIRLLNILRI